MIRVAESQLEERLQEAQSREESPSSPSPLGAAWQEMLNHATTKVGVAHGSGCGIAWSTCCCLNFIVSELFVKRENNLKIGLVYLFVCMRHHSCLSYNIARA